MKLNLSVMMSTQPAYYLLYIKYSNPENKMLIFTVHVNIFTSFFLSQQFTTLYPGLQHT